MKRLAVSMLLLAATASFAQDNTVRADDDPDSWKNSARFFTGVRGGVAIPPGGDGVASTLGLELGVSAKQGVGFGLHLIGMQNTPPVQPLSIPRANWALGAAADVRFYFQTVEPLTLYPTLSVGFVGGTGANNKNVVLPLFNPGFGARVKFDKLYVAFEFGAASFTIPFVNLCIGWEPERKQPTRQLEAEMRKEAQQQAQAQSQTESQQQTEAHPQKTVQQPQKTMRRPLVATDPYVRESGGKLQEANDGSESTSQETQP